MLKRYNQKGTALVEYAVLLSFVGVIALSFGGDNGLTGSISGAVNKATNTINMTLGMSGFSEEALKNALVQMKDSNYKTYEFDSQTGHVVLGSDFIDGSTYDNSIAASKNFEKDFLSKLNFGEVSLESWRFLNEGQGSLTSQYAYLVWSDTDWGNGNFREVEASKTACMYARIDKSNNTVQYGVAYANPLYIHKGDGTINGWRTDYGGMVNISEGLSPNLRFDNNWQDKDAYLASNSPYFTPDYSTAVNLYKELQAKSQS